MPRAITGIYTLSVGNPVVSGTTIATTWANTSLTDIATAMTDSLSRSGDGGMLAGLKMIDGTAANPALCFTNGAGTGLSLGGSGALQGSVNGVQLLEITSDDFRISTTNPPVWYNGAEDEVLATTSAPVFITSITIGAEVITEVTAGYLNGVTSDVQTQIDGKVGPVHTHTAADTTAGQFADDRISGSSVGQYEAILNIRFTQLTENYFEHKSVSTVRTATTARSNDPHLQATLPPGVYQVECVLFFHHETAGVGGGFSYSPVFTGTLNTCHLVIEGFSPTTNYSPIIASYNQASIISGGAIANCALEANATSKAVRIGGVVSVASTGLLSIRWAQITSNIISTELLAGSYLRATKSI